MASDRTLKRFRAGDPGAVRELYDEYGRAVFVVAMRALGDRSLAEEVVQQTFLKAWRASSSFDASRSIGPWLYAIARRAAIDAYRRERRHRGVDAEPEIVALPASFEDTWAAWEVRLALDRLPEEERQVLRATHYAGLTHAEAAAALEIPLGTVKSRAHRAYRRLAGMLSHLEEASA